MIKNFSRKIIVKVLAVVLALTCFTTASLTNEVYADNNNYIKVIKNTTTSSVRMRSGRGTKYKTILTIPKGKTVKVITSSNGWNEVEYNGKKGYVSSKYLKTTTSTPSKPQQPQQPSQNQQIESVIALAYKQLGKKYVYGAAGPNNFDCSGLTSYCFKNAIGKTIPRTSREQSKTGTYVSLSNLKRGDLIFFGNKKTGKVSHVVIYLGNNQYLHSPRTGDVVKISSTNTSYFRANALFGRRILN